MSDGAKVITLPRTKLVEGSILFECACGAGLKYPGHPPDRKQTDCDRCGRSYVVRSAVQ